MFCILDIKEMKHMPFYTKPRHTPEPIDFTNHRFVPVIVSYNTDGACVPLYFRYLYQDGSRDDVAIDRVVDTKETMWNVAYHCDITANDRRCRIVLTFHKDLNKWSLTCS